MSAETVQLAAELESKHGKSPAGVFQLACVVQKKQYLVEEGVDSKEGLEALQNE